MDSTNTDFFRDASGNFGANRTLFSKYAGGMANPVGNASNPDASAAYNSRVRASVVNGAGSPADPARAPWNFTDFVFGRKTVVGQKGEARRKIGIVQIAILIGVLYIVFKCFIKKS